MKGRARALVEAAHRQVAALEREMVRLRKELFASAAKHRSLREINGLRRKLKELEDQAIAKARAAIAIPENERGEVTINHAPMSLGTLPWEGAAIVQAYTDPSLLPKIEVVEQVAGKRARYSDGKIYIHPDSLASTVAHEIAHGIEGQNPTVLAACKAFLASRTVGETPRKLSELTGNSEYKDYEVAYEDKWADRGGDAYSGRRYEDATEILTVGIQRLHQNPLRFARQDPDYFSFVVNTLRNW